MRIYKRDQEDKVTSINRCFFDAQQGRVELALERIRDLFLEFPADANVHYAHGLLLRDHLGRGLAAREAFESAFDASDEVSEIRGLAACNIVSLARDYEDFQRWAAVAEKVAPNDKGLRALCEFRRQGHAAGDDYWATTANLAAEIGEQGDVAGAAVNLEIALLGGSFHLSDEVHFRRSRAQCLRRLDLTASQTREMLNEFFPPAERLALHDAVAELERAIELDEFDAELWNLRAAWSFLLRKYEDTVAFAEKAITLRPRKYGKPWENKARALWFLGRTEEARACAREAMQQAEAAGNEKDRASAEAIVVVKKDASTIPSAEDFAHWMKEFTKAAAVTSRKEISQQGWSGNCDILVKGFLDRARPHGSAWHRNYILIVAELLTYVTPETVLQTLQEVRLRNRAAYDHAFHAVLYVVAKSEGVRQRDAVRLLCLGFLTSSSLETARKAYRLAVLESSAAADDEVGELESLVGEELARINTWLPKLLADQEPVNEAGRERARTTILRRFKSDDPVAVSFRSANVGRAGCLPVLAVPLGLLAWFYWPSTKDALLYPTLTTKILVGVVLGFVGLSLIAAAGGRRLMRAHMCARCSRPLEKVAQDQYGVPGVIIRSGALMSGAEGIGRECLRCGRTYCSDCEDSNTSCQCGHSKLKMVRVVYGVIR